MSAAQKLGWVLLATSLVLIAVGLYGPPAPTAPSFIRTNSSATRAPSSRAKPRSGRFDDRVQRQADSQLPCPQFKGCALTCQDGLTVTRRSERMREQRCEKDGKPHGTSISFFKDGNRSHVRHYAEGKLHGQTLVFFPNGRRSAMRHHHNGQLHGVSIEYKNRPLHELAQLARVKHYRHGKKHGVERHWNAEGFLYSESHWQDGRREGPSKKWHSNGQLKWQGQFKNSQLVGITTGWHADGQRWIERPHKNGKAHGTATRWHRNGDRSSWTWHGGVLQGPHQSWHANGRQSTVGNFHEDRRHGRFQTWDKHGQLQSDCVYKEGQLVRTQIGDCPSIATDTP